jgi:hypothetical protein
MVSRTQSLVLGFLSLVVVLVVTIRVAAPPVYERALQLPSGGGWSRFGVPGGLLAFIALLAFGVLRRWRWLFWGVLAAFLAGVLRVPAVLLQLTGVLAADVPDWYLVLQGVLGLLQFLIGLIMIADFRRFGVWGSGRPAQDDPERPKRVAP